MDLLDELEIEGYGYKIINKKLKLKRFKLNLSDNSNKQLMQKKESINPYIQNPLNENNNNNLIIENKKLKSELNTFKTKNEELKNEINKLNDENRKLKNELTKAKRITSNNINLPNNQHENANMIKQLNDLIIMKDNLEFKLQNKDKKDLLVNYDNILFVHFISLDQKINCGIKCLKTDTFAEVEEKLYQKYRETNNNFITKGRTVLRFKKIFENNIQDGDKIQLLKPE